MPLYSGLSRRNYVQCDRLVGFTKHSDKTLVWIQAEQEIEGGRSQAWCQPMILERPRPPEIHKLNNKSQSQCNQVLYSTYKTPEAFLICTLSQVCSVILHCDRMFSSIKSGCLHNVLSKLKMDCRCRVECGWDIDPKYVVRKVWGTVLSRDLGEVL